MSADTAKAPPALLRAVRAVQTTIAIAAVVIIVVSTVADVALRYGFGRPIHGAYDIVECLLVVFVFNGLSLVFLDRAHIIIDLIDHWSGARQRRRLIRFGDLACVVALALILWAMIEPALQAYDYGDRKLELGIKVWIVWAFAFGGTIGAIVCAVFVAWAGERRR